MSTISLTLPVSGTVITAGLHSTNYTTIQTAINGGLDTANWAPGKIFAPSKIMQESAVDGDGLAWDNTAALWKRTTDKALRVGAIAPGSNGQVITTSGGATVWGGSSGVLNRLPLLRSGTVTSGSAVVTGLAQTSDLAIGMTVTGTNIPASTTILTVDSGTQVTLSANATGTGTVTLTFGPPDVANTTSERSIFVASIAANTMGTDKMLRLTLIGDYLKNNVAGDTHTLRIKFGGTTFYAGASQGLGVTGANRQPWRLGVEVANLGATNSQMIEGWYLHERPDGAAPTTGIGVWSNGGNPQAGTVGISTLGTIDTTAAQTLDVTVQWSAANASNSWRTRYAALELV